MTFFSLLIFIGLGALLLILLVPIFFIRLLTGRGAGYVHRNGAGSNGYVHRPRGKREGEVSIQGDQASNEDKIIDDKIGEYVDFEEVKD